jgi:hypothetical protein
MSKFVLILASLLLAIALAACGGDEAPEGAATVVVAPTEAAEAPAEEPTEVPATEASPTEAPTAEAATEEPATAAPDEPVLMTGDCGNAFYPVVEGRVLTYNSTIAGLGESTFSTTFSDVSESSFTVTTDVGDEEAISVTWICTGEGMLSPEFSQLPGAGEGFSIEFVEAEGVTIPSEDLFQPGESWSTHYVANATMADTGAGEMTMVQTMDMTNTVTGIETVSVPAGDYPEAVRVETTGTIGIAMSIGDTAQPATSVPMSYITWYVEGIGMVRQDLSSLLGEGGVGDSVTELVSVE